MRGKSHLCLGIYLAEKYMPQTSPACIRAFLLGCIQPDRNPLTYLKGSIRHQWMRGHNYPNACKYISRLSVRLENKEKFTILDYYSLGKLIHYTVDAFTLAHNTNFPEDLAQHRIYETALQHYFLIALRNDPNTEILSAATVAEIICIYHQEYSCQIPGICNDTLYALNASCSILAHIFEKQNTLSNGVLI